VTKNGGQQEAEDDCSDKKELEKERRTSRGPGRARDSGETLTRSRTERRVDAVTKRYVLRRFSGIIRLGK
jgi:hypothetical protein